MTLQTDLKHLSTSDDFNKLIQENEKVMICCGRMGPMCMPVYGVMEELEEDNTYEKVTFADMLFDNPQSAVIRNLPECSSFMGLPFTVYFKDGKLAKATSSIQSKEQITEIIENNLCN